MTEPTERVEVDLDPATLRSLRGRAQQRGGTVGTHAAGQLRRLALADSARLSEQALLEISPTYFTDMAEETEAAMAEAERG